MVSRLAMAWLAALAPLDASHLFPWTCVCPVGLSAHSFSAVATDSLPQILLLASGLKLSLTSETKQNKMKQKAEKALNSSSISMPFVSMFPNTYNTWPMFPLGFLLAANILTEALFVALHILCYCNTNWALANSLIPSLQTWAMSTYSMQESWYCFYLLHASPLCLRSVKNILFIHPYSSCTTSF